MILFKSIPYSSVLNDILKILEKNNLNILECDYERGLIKAKILPSLPVEDIHIIAKLWKGKDRILIGLRGSLSFSFSGAEKLKKKLRELETDLRRLEYAY